MPHTGGSWEFDGEHIVGQKYICRLEDWHISAAGGQYDDVNQSLREERAANGRLIATAPDLLAAAEAAESADKDEFAYRQKRIALYTGTFTDEYRAELQKDLDEFSRRGVEANRLRRAAIAKARGVENASN